MKPLRVLMLVGDPERRNQLAELLRGADHRVETVPDAASAAESMREPGFDTLVIDLDVSGLDVTALRQAISPSDSIEPGSLDAAEQRHLAQVLRHTAGNKRKAALLLGISRSTLLNKVRKYGLALLLALGCLVLPAGTALVAQTPVPIPSGRVTSGKLSFEGHATIGDFVGTTSSISGQVAGGAHITQVRGWVAAPVQTLTTGNGKRDKDLNKSMESSKYPDIRFELAGISSEGGKADSLTATLHGKLLIHGVARTVALPAILQFRGSEVRVRSDFPLSLKDYRVGGLSKMLGMLKMYDNIEVHVDVLFGLVPSTSSAAARQ